MWSIVPNLTSSGDLNLTKTSSLLTVPVGGFTPLTNYSIIVRVTNIMYPIATKTRVINFSTS